MNFDMHYITRRPVAPNHCSFFYPVSPTINRRREPVSETRKLHAIRLPRYASFKSRSAFRWLIFSLSAGLIAACSKKKRPCSFVL
jgi:hypothetical protein